MKNTYQKLLVKIALWLVVEIALNVVGIDNLADYGEFTNSKKFGDMTIVAC